MRMFTIVVLIICFIIAAYVLSVYPDRPETWSVVTAVLAVIVSLISAESSWAVIQNERDKQSPKIQAYLDYKSRNQLFMFRVENIGGSPAYKVKINWENPLIDRNGNVVRFSKDPEGIDIPILLPNHHLSKSTDVIHKFMAENGGKVFEGNITYQNSIKKIYRQKFELSVKELEGVDLYDNETQLTHLAVQKIPKEIQKLENEIKNITKTLRETLKS